jgi:hypothetical protein
MDTIPSFIKNIFESFAQVNWHTNQSHQIAFEASLLDNPQATFAGILHCTDSPFYLEKHKVVQSLTLLPEDIPTYQQIADKAVFVFLCDTTREHVFYSYIRPLTWDWEKTHKIPFQFFLPLCNILTAAFPDVFKQDIALIALDENRYQNPLEDYKKVFPTLFGGYDEIDTLLEHLRSRYDYTPKEVIFERYPTCESLPTRFIEGMLQIFINSANTQKKVVIVEICLRYDLKCIVPHLLRAVERLIVDTKERHNHKYGYALGIQMYKADFAPYFDALLAFNVQEEGIYARLKHLLSYNNTDLKYKVEELAFVWNLPEALPDFEAGILTYPKHIGYDRLAKDKIIQLYADLLVNTTDTSKQLQILEMFYGCLHVVAGRQDVYQCITALYQVAGKRVEELLIAGYQYCQTETKEERFPSIFYKTEAEVIQEEIETKELWLAQFLEVYQSKNEDAMKHYDTPFGVHKLIRCAPLNPIFLEIYTDATKWQDEFHTQAKKAILVSWHILTNPNRKKTTNMSYSIEGLRELFLRELITAYKMDSSTLGLSIKLDTFRSYRSNLFKLCESLQIHLPNEIILSLLRESKISLYEAEKLESEISVLFAQELLVQETFDTQSLNTLCYIIGAHMVADETVHAQLLFHLEQIVGLDSSLDFILETLKSLEKIQYPPIQAFLKNLCSNKFIQSPHLHYDLPTLEKLHKSVPPDFMGETMLNLIKDRNFEKGLRSVYHSNHSPADVVEFQLDMVARMKTKEAYDFLRQALLNLYEHKAFEPDDHSRFIIALLLKYFRQEAEPFLLNLLIEDRQSYTQVNYYIKNALGIDFF